MQQDDCCPAVSGQAAPLRLPHGVVRKLTLQKRIRLPALQNRVFKLQMGATEKSAIEAGRLREAHRVWCK